jgi:hypothetical protein
MVHGPSGAVLPVEKEGEKNASPVITFLLVNP